MSVEHVHRTTLWCDYHGCVTKLFWQTVHYLSLEVIGEYARRSGWTVDAEGRARCLEHKGQAS